MRLQPYELELPIDEGPVSALARKRIDHVRTLGLDGQELVRLVRSFRSLRALYSATEEQLAAVVGPVTAARIRWFLDAPLETRLVAETSDATLRTLRSAA